MKLLILGGTGTISQEIVRQALIAKHQVTIFNRGSKKSPYADQITTLCGDRSDDAAFQAQMATVDVDVVIDMICFQASDARQLLQAFKGRVKQIIVTSSIAAYDRPYKSHPIQESQETLRTDPTFAYGFQKAEMERYLHSEMDDSTAITILRPSLTFGDGSANFGILRQNRNVVRRIAQGKPVVTVGEGVIPWSFTFAPDLAQAYMLACGNEQTYNDCFHVTNTELVLWEDLYKAIGKALDKDVDFCPIPSSLLRAFYPSVCSHLNFEKVHFSYFSNEKFLKAAPTYKPCITVDEGVKNLLAWWEETQFPYDDDKEALEDRICQLYSQFRDDLLALAP